MSTASPRRPIQDKTKRPLHVKDHVVNSVVAQRSTVTESKQVEDPVWGPWLPERLTWKNLDWTVLGWMTIMHAGAIAAPFYFNWQSFGVAVFLYWLTASVGICLGYHRFLSHKSMKLVAPVRFLTTLAGVLSGEGSPINWSATHRLHHQRSDQEGDPHSPLITAIWSHLTWLFVRHSKEQRMALYKKYTPDLLNDPMLMFFEHTYFLWLLGTGAVLWAVGGMPMLLWGLCMRMVFAYHGTWFVNSATHLWGYRNYDTRDESRNLWWVAIWAFGEGWHNNHHAHPHVAPAGHRWWELDPTWWVIKTLRFLGLAYDVDDRIPAPQDRSPAPAEA